MASEPAGDSSKGLVDKFLGAAPWRMYGFDDISNLPETNAILGADPRMQIAVIRDCVDRMAAVRSELGDPELNQHAYWNISSHKRFPKSTLPLIARLFRRKLPFTHADLTYLINRISDLDIILIHAIPFAPTLVALAEQLSASGPLPSELQSSLARFHGAIAKVSNAPECKLRERIAFLLRSENRKLNSVVKPDSNVIREHWSNLLRHCATASSPKPSAKWNAAAENLIEAIGLEAIHKCLFDWFALVPQPYEPEARRIYRWKFADPTGNTHDIHDDCLRGLIWLTPLMAHAEFPRAIAAIVETALKKLPNVGPRWPKIANAAIYALGVINDSASLAQLARLKVRVRFGTALKQIEKALDAVAAAIGTTREDLDEISIPNCGLSPEGVRTALLGTTTATLRIASSGVELYFTNQAGKRLKSMPAVIKADFAEQLADLKSAHKDITQMLPAIRDRLDRLMLSTKAWPIAIFRQRYLDHALVGTIARRLIWKIGRESGMWRDGRLVSVDDDPMELRADAQVELWHPIGLPMDEVLAWRGYLQRHQIRQPFKQAFREVYLLTDAERNTRTYSNRYAAHVIRQHQFNALCAARGWKSKLRLMVDAEYVPPSRDLQQWGLRAEFWVEGIGENYGTDTNESGVFLRLATDQVRFYRTGAVENYAHAGGGGYRTGAGGPGEGNINEPLALEQIPPLVFSEVMRDVDLFVGVASVGNDPTWQDGGPQGRYQTYWQNFSFGDLNETAKTRRAVLETLVPRLKIAGQCSLLDKFLRVQGKLRAYKIHLGSGNILMEPNDQYLCIVASQSGKAGGDLYLPFEGDSTLAVILSKAFLLAADDKIKDETITRQIRG